MSETDARADDPGQQRLDDRRTGDAGLGLEASEADVAEQLRAAREEQPAAWPRHVPYDVDPADAADQERSVDLDEDDYR